MVDARDVADEVPDDAMAVEACAPLWNVPVRARHVVVRGAERADESWLARLLGKLPRRLTLHGNARALGHAWFAELCATRKVPRHDPDRRVPFHALFETLAEAVRHLEAHKVDFRVLAGCKADAQRALARLRNGFSAGLQEGDPVLLWRSRRLTRVVSIRDAAGQPVPGCVDLGAPNAKHLRVQTATGVACAAKDVNSALVQTPATLRGRSEAIVVLPGVGLSHALAAEEHADVALIGVGRAFALRRQTALPPRTSTCST